jgi:hypothetical protein
MRSHQHLLSKSIMRMHPHDGYLFWFQLPIPSGILPHVDRRFILGLDKVMPGFHSGWETLFSLYVHSPPGHTYPSRSIFHGREIANRIKVDWGSFTVVRQTTAYPIPYDTLLSACPTSSMVNCTTRHCNNVVTSTVCQNSTKIQHV